MGGEPVYRLASYRPLSSTAAGRLVARKFDIPGFVDGSCRREPDFQETYPSITSICRYDRFAPYLQVGHRVAYITVKGGYPDDAPHWRLVAGLQVIKRFENHADAAAWYCEKRASPPSNCVVPGNPPLPVDRTLSPERDLSRWNAIYEQRARLVGTFLACEPEEMELVDPPKLTEDDLMRIFKRIPGTQTPAKISRDEYEQLLAMLSGR